LNNNVSDPPIGRVYVFGRNELGQLGLGDYINRSRPTLIQNIMGKHIIAGESSSFIIDMNNNLFAFGDNEEGNLGLGDRINRSVPTQLENFKAKKVSTGVDGTLLIDMDNNMLVPTLIHNFKARDISVDDYSLIIGVNMTNKKNLALMLAKFI
jgi:hypothetical protein